MEIINQNPLTLLLKLPDGCQPGRYESCESFSEIFGELKKKYPNKKFDFLPFAYASTKDGSALTSVLAIAQ